MGYLKVYCDNCGGEWHVYHRDTKNNPYIRQCPHCYAKIEPYTWKQIVRGFGEMLDSEKELAKDHANHIPLFTVDFVSDAVYENAKHRDRTCEQCEIFYDLRD